MSNATGDGRSSRAEARDEALAFARSIVDAVREPLVILDGHLRVQSANRAFYHTFGVSPQDAHDQCLYEIGNRQWDIPRLRTLLEEVLLNDTSFNDYEIEHDVPDIGRKVMLLNARRLQQEGAELILLAFEDVTERRRAEQTMQASEQRLRMALDVAFTLAFEWDIPRNEVRHHHSRMGAVPETPERPSSLEEVCAAIHPDDRESFLANLHAALAHPERGYRGEHRLCEPDGRIVWLADHGYLECDGQGHPQRLIGLSQDITERKAAEEALRASEVRYRTLVEATGAITWSCPPSGLQVAPQPEWMGFTGQTAEQMLGTGWGDAVHPEDVALAAQHWQDAVAREVPFVNEHRIRRHDGEWRWMSVHAAPIRDVRGEVVEWIGMSLDITERKQAEAALRESDRRKDEFLATLAHELRNPLAPIRTGLDLAQALRGDAAACEEPLRIMDRQISHLVRLVDDLLDVHRISRGKIQLRKERINLADVINAALEMSDSGLNRSDRQLTVSVPPEPLAVEGDWVRLLQIVSNLLNNALKFTDEGGRIDIRVTPRGEQVEIQVQDDGRGIPRERLDNIFEIFTQVEPGLDGGLGIGLSLVRGLVELHGGTVSAESQGFGCGATFTVFLPLCCSAPAQPAADEVADLGVLPAECRVLAVDDNRDITEGLRLLLSILGAEVRVAHDGAEAIRICDDWLPTVSVLRNTFFRWPGATPMMLSSPVREEQHHGMATAQSQRVAKVVGGLAA